MVIVNFKPGQTAIKVLTGVWQRDYGQVLRITGLSLPTSVEVHFAKENATEAIPMDGTTVDGVTDVWIPDELLNGSEMWNYHIYAYIYLTDDTSGQTEYVVDMLVKTRAKTGTDNPSETEQSLFTETINAVNAAADRAEAAAKSAESANITVDSELNETSTNPIQNAVVAKEISRLTERIKNQTGSGTGAGWTTEQINLLDSIGNFIPFTSADGGTLWNNLITSLRSGSGEEEPDTPIEPEVTLTAISATYSGGEVAVGTALTYLTGIVVTAVYSDGTSEEITDYTLSGEIVEGENAITVSYSGKTATFTVTGIAESTGEELGWESGVPYEIAWTDGHALDNNGLETESESMSVSDYLPCRGLNRMVTANLYSNYKLWYYDADKNFLRVPPTSYVVNQTNIETYRDVCYVRTFKRLATTNASITPYCDDLLDDKTVWESGKFYRLNWKDGYGANGTTGAEYENDSNCISDFAFCYGATSLQFSNASRSFVNWYDADKQYIKSEIRQNVTTAVTIPENASYFRITGNITTLNYWVQLS